MQSEHIGHEKVSETKCSQDLPDFIEGDGTFEIPLYVSYVRHRRQAAGSEADRREESQQEVPRSQPGSCE